MAGFRAYSILTFLAQRKDQNRTRELVWGKTEPLLFDDNEKPKFKGRKSIWRLAK